MNLVYLLEYYYPHVGGVETVFKNLCEGMVRKGHVVTVITTRLPGTRKKECVNGVHIHRVFSPNSNRYFFPLTSLYSALSYAKHADLIHTTTYAAAFPAWLTGVITKKKVLLTVHEVWIDKWRRFTEKSKIGCFIHNIAEKILFSLPFHAYITVSHATEIALRKKVHSNTIQTIYNGVDYAHWKPKKYDEKSIRKKENLKEKFVYLGYGRPGTSKGFSYLIAAMKKVKKHVPQAVLILILSKSKAYKKRYASLQKEANGLPIIFLEPQPYATLPAYVKMSDCVVVPSLTEGFGYSCAEANAIGTPVVGTNNSSLPEVIQFGKLVPPGDATALADAMISVAKEDIDTFPKKTFSWEKTIQAYEKTYKRIA